MMGGCAPGVDAWVDLTDTPGSITALQFVRGNAGGTALEFVDPGLTNYLRRDGSNTITGIITADGDATRDFGAFDTAFRRVYGRNLVSGYTPSPTASLTIAQYYATIGGIVGIGAMTGAGANNFYIGGGYYSPAATFGNTYAPQAGDTAEIINSGGGSFLTGSAFVGSSATSGSARLNLGPSSYGSFLGGYAFQATSSGTALLQNEGSGSFVWGYVNGGGTGTSAIQSTSNAAGAFVAGRCQDAGAHTLQATAQGAFAVGICQNNGNHIIQATGIGSFAQGRCAGNIVSGTIEATSQGSFCQGRTNNLARLTSSGRGSFCQGNAQNSGAYIQATQNGAFAHGHVNGAYYISASGQGSFAVGRATTATGNIVASGSGSVQFGPGTNAVPDSLQVGSDFLAKPNGQHAGAFDSLTLVAAATTFVATSNDMIITGDAGANTIATITGGINGQFLCLIFVDALVTVTDDNTHAADSIDLSAAFTSADDTVLLLKYDGTSWYEVSRSVN